MKTTQASINVLTKQSFKRLRQLCPNIGDITAEYFILEIANFQIMHMGMTRGQALLFAFLSCRGIQITLRRHPEICSNLDKQIPFSLGKYIKAAKYDFGVDDFICFIQFLQTLRCEDFCTLTVPFKVEGNMLYIPSELNTKFRRMWNPDYSNAALQDGKYQEQNRLNAQTGTAHMLYDRRAVTCTERMQIRPSLIHAMGILG